MTGLIQFIIAIGITLMSWAGMIACLIGLGLLPQWLMGLRKQATGASVFRAFWMGFAVTVAWLQIWHLFVRVNGWATLTLAFAGVSGLLLFRRVLRQLLFTALTKHRWAALFTALASVWLADRCLGSMDPNCDSMGYHLHAVHWLNSYAIVPGLGNLRSRLAFNNASLLWPAVLEVGFWRGRSWHIANGALMLVLIWRGITSLACLTRANSKPAHRFHRVFEAMTLAPLVSQAVSLLDLRISTVDTDATAAFVFTAATILMLRPFSFRHAGRATDYQLLAVTSLFSLTVCCKVSLAVFCVSAWIAAFVWWWRMQERSGTRAGRSSTTAIIVAASALIVGVWVMRGTILSGYPLFPTRLLPMPVDWRMPVENVAETSRAIFDWAKNRALFSQLWPNYPHWSLPWFVWQFTRSPELILGPAILALGGLIFLTVTHAQNAQARTAKLLAAIAVPAIIFWLTFAPEPRFGFVYFWSAAGALIGGCASSITTAHWCRRRQWFIAALIALAFLPIAHRVAAYTYQGNPSRVFETLFIGPGPDAGFHPILPAQTRSAKTDSGLEVERDAKSGVGYAPLLYVDRFDPKLRLRKADSLADGFMVEENPRAP